MVAIFPHCDSQILHYPGECDTCDKYPQLQANRILDRINFTGHYDPLLASCPADLARPTQSYNQWGGNTPKKGKVLGYDYAGYEVTEADPRVDFVPIHDPSKCNICLDDQKRMEAIMNPEVGVQHGYSYPEPGIPFIISPRISVWIARLRRNLGKVFK